MDSRFSPQTIDLPTHRTVAHHLHEGQSVQPPNHRSADTKSVFDAVKHFRVGSAPKPSICRHSVSRLHTTARSSSVQPPNHRSADTRRTTPADPASPVGSAPKPSICRHFVSRHPELFLPRSVQPPNHRSADTSDTGPDGTSPACRRFSPQTIDLPTHQSKRRPGGTTSCRFSPQTIDLPTHGQAPQRTSVTFESVQPPNHRSADTPRWVHIPEIMGSSVQPPNHRSADTSAGVLLVVLGEEVGSAPKPSICRHHLTESVADPRRNVGSAPKPSICRHLRSETGRLRSPDVGSAPKPSICRHRIGNQCRVRENIVGSAPKPSICRHAAEIRASYISTSRRFSPQTIDLPTLKHEQRQPTTTRKSVQPPNHRSADTLQRRARVRGR